jgi:integrase
MALIKRNQIYYYQDPSTSKRTSLKTKCRKTAQKIKKDLDERYTRYKLGLISREEYLARPVEKTIQDIYNIYSTAELSSKKVIRYYTSKLTPFCKKYGATAIQDFTYKDACDYKSDLLKDNTSKTANNHLSEIKRMFEWAKNAKYLKENVFNIRGYLPSIKPTKPRYAIPLKHILYAINKSENISDRVYWTILLHTGLRRNDAGNLTEDNVVRGIFQQKSKEFRKIMITDTLKNYGILIYKAMATDNEQKKSLKRFQTIIQNKFGYYTDFHSIRHTTMTLLVNTDGFDETQVGRILGTESSVASYAHIDFERATKAISKLIGNA